MFDWTVPRVLAAIDAGIAEVIRTYNDSYLFAIRNGTPIWHAHAYAQTATITWLDQVEAERLMIAAINNCLNTIALNYNPLNDPAEITEAEAWSRFYEDEPLPRTAAGYAATRLSGADAFEIAYEAYENSMNPGNWA